MVEKEPAAPRSAWVYRVSEDEMGRGAVKTATARSVNEIEFASPYEGRQRAELRLRSHPEHGNDVILSIERGQFLCRIRGCNVTVRFGDGNSERFRAVGPSDHGATSLFLRNFNSFKRKAMRVDTIRIEAEFFRSGTRVLQFDVAGLEWPPPNPER